MIKGYLYETRRLGLYHFEANTPPQKYMREAIVRKFPHVHQGSFILEVGPGEHPLFTPQEYANWYAVDKYWEDGRIKFKGLEWAKDKYPSGRVFSGDFDNLEDVFRPKALVGAFDLVVASHSYEHVFRPIESLKQAHRMLKPGGAICLFVPDGFTDDVNTKDPTHTLYVVPGMMEEFFHYSGGWREIAIEAFRPNADLIVTAVKE